MRFSRNLMWCGLLLHATSTGYKGQRCVENAILSTVRTLDTIDRQTLGKVCSILDLSVEILEKVCTIEVTDTQILEKVCDIQATSTQILEKVCDIQATTTQILEKICDLAACHVPITQADVGSAGFTILSSGGYALVEPITFSPANPASAITIAASNVTLDLQCSSLSQGNATSDVNGILVANGVTDVTIKGGALESFTGVGISVQDNTRRINVQDQTILACQERAIEYISASTNIHEGIIQNVIISGCCTSSSGANNAILLEQTENIVIKNSRLIENGVSTEPLNLIEFSSCVSCDVKDVLASENVGNPFVAFQLTAPARCTFSDCLVRNCSSPQAFTGFNLSGSLNACNLFEACVLLENSAGTLFNGFNLQANSQDNVFMHCNVICNSAQSSDLNGFFLSGGVANNIQNSFFDCLIQSNTTGNEFAGIRAMDANFSTVHRCTVSDNFASGTPSIGLRFDNASNWSVTECLFHRNNVGIGLLASGIRVFSGTNNLFSKNIAFNNGTTPASQLAGVPLGSKTTPAVPATDNLNSVTAPWTNIAAAT